jgi:predicted nucleic acid-binding Zn ribbon protein
MERIGSEVERTLGQTGGGLGLALAEITRVWPTAVGNAVARQAWPARVGRDGTLHVATSSSTWAFELDRLAGEIQQQLRDHLGANAPTQLRFKVGAVPEPGASSTHSPDTRPKAFPSSPETDAEAALVASEIEDPELREMVARAARASLARSRVRPPFLVD